MDDVESFLINVVYSEYSYFNKAVYFQKRKKSHRLEGNIFKSHTVSPKGLVSRENEFSKLNSQETIGPIRKSAKDWKDTLS